MQVTDEELGPIGVQLVATEAEDLCHCNFRRLHSLEIVVLSASTFEVCVCVAHHFRCCMAIIACFQST